MARIALCLATLATAGYLGAAHATYPGENGVIVFADPATGQIGRVAPSSNAPITYLQAGTNPAVSPSGRKIAYRHSTGIRVMNIDGSNVVQLTNNSTDRFPTWYPDGTKLAFIRGGTDVRAINANGLGEVFVRSLPGGEFLPRGFQVVPEVPLSQALRAVYTHTGGSNLLDLAPPFGTATFQATPIDAASWAPEYDPTDPVATPSIIYSRNGVAQEDYNDGSPRTTPTANGLTAYNTISPDGKYIAAGVGGTSQSGPLALRPRAGGASLLGWPATVGPLDWSRVPKNCYGASQAGVGPVLTGDLEFYAVQCAVTVMPDGGAHGFLALAAAIGTDGAPYYSGLVVNPFGAPAWSPFVPVPGPQGAPRSFMLKKIAVAGAKDGSIQMVVIGRSDIAYFNSMSADGTWTGFKGLGLGTGASDVAIAISGSSSTSPGNAQIIANKMNGGGLWHSIHAADGTWSPFAQIPGSGGTLFTFELAIAAGEDGNSYVLATGVQPPYNSVQLLRQVRYANGSWDPSFINVALPGGVTLDAFSDVALTLTADDKAQLMYTDSFGRARFQQRSNPLVQSSWTNPAGIDTVVSPSGNRSVSISAPPALSPSEMLLVRTSAQ